MFCEQCGIQIGDDKRFCQQCESLIESNDGQKVEDQKSIGFGILGFFIPLVGLILFLIWKKDTPIKAKSCGIGALIGFVLGIVIQVIFMVATTVAQRGRAL